MMISVSRWACERYVIDSYSPEYLTDLKCQMSDRCRTMSFGRSTSGHGGGAAEKCRVTRLMHLPHDFSTGLSWPIQLVSVILRGNKAVVGRT